MKSPSRQQRGAARAALDDDEDDLAYGDPAPPPSPGRRRGAPAPDDDDDDRIDLDRLTRRPSPPPRGRKQGGARAAFEDDDDDDFGSRRAKGRGAGNLVWGGAALTLAGGLIGAWLLVAGNPAASPASPTDLDNVAGMTQALPPSVGALSRSPQNALMSPPGVEETDRSMARRPWLAETPAPAPAAAPGVAPEGPGQGQGPGQGPETTVAASAAEAAPSGAPAARPPADPSPTPAPMTGPTTGPTTGPLAASPSPPPGESAEAGAPSLRAAAATLPGAAQRRAGMLLPTDPPPLAAVPPLPVEEGYRPGRMPTYGDLPAPGSLGASPLPDAPLTDLLRASEHGMLPVIGQDGREPWRTYARPFTGNPSKPRIALVITGLGMRATATQAAITQMPPDVTLAFSPYAPTLPVWMGRARQAGHETLMELPVEPVGFPTLDPGNLGLLSTVSDLENRKRLELTLASGGGYVGVIATTTGRFSDSPASLRPVLETLKARGLLYIHRGAAGAVNGNADIAPAVNTVSLVLDNPAFQRAIDQRLAALEETARTRGHAIGTLSASPLALYRATRWLAGLEGRGFALAPVSALVLIPENGASR